MKDGGEETLQNALKDWGGGSIIDRFEGLGGENRWEFFFKVGQFSARTVLPLIGESKKTKTLLHLFTAYVHDLKLKSIHNEAKLNHKFI